MKILITNTIINISDLKQLKTNHKVTFNAKEQNIDLIVTDKNMYFSNYKDYCIEYGHWLNKTSLSFIVDALNETLYELNSMNF
ncbi:hypothetical protein [uncultured Clostridium sp.]|uniref:hypothetical protein n=1 Tax=uncultured Clostridium sp. TaxID=59620 RepID=UPI0028F0DD79|nr:hypothetical protein [uncultured Clostridium sp.]